MCRVAACGLLSVVGCGFGGPLIAETDDGDATETSTETGTENRCGPISGVVERVIDGDTVILESGERIRYILVDTPEITAGKNECYGQEGSDYNKVLVLGQTVSLEYDQECEDQYGRLLAYVSVGGFEVNRALLVGGFACILHISPNGDTKIVEYQGLENTAKSDGVGMWSACADVTCEW